MPIFEIECMDCGRAGEVLIIEQGSELICPECGSSHTRKKMSAPSSLTGRAAQSFPGPGDHSCCGTSPPEAGCAGPGSCCGKTGGM